MQKGLILVTLYVDDISPGVTTLGPGNRIGLWLQGCTLGCPGCMSPELFERRESCRQKVGEVFRQILLRAPDHRGLTVSGGEPFQQAPGLRKLLFLVRRHTSLDILVYSGYTLGELEKGPAEMAAALSLVDVLIAGRYRCDLPSSEPWLGSGNQQMHLLSPRARLDQEYANPSRGNSPSLQVHIGKDETLNLIGIPRAGDRTRFKELLLRRGIELKK